MPSTIQCEHCGVVLNLPPQAVGKRLKCPRCAQRIEPQVGGAPAAPKSAGPATGTARPASSAFNPTSKSSGEIDLPMATAAGDLRETFDLLSMTGEVGNSGGGGVADAVALFQEQRPAQRRVGGGDARKQARRCPTCGGFVPQGMSLCGSCGYDLDTGVRVDLEVDLLPMSVPRRNDVLPIGIAVIGGISLLGSIALTAVALVSWQRGLDGAQYLALVCFFGIYAAAQFLRGRTARFLIVALTLGVMFDVVALIGLPIYDAQNLATLNTPTRPADSDVEETGASAPISDYLDTTRIGWGVVILLTYAAVAIYLNSPPVRRHFERV